MTAKKSDAKPPVSIRDLVQQRLENARRTVVPPGGHKIRVSRNKMFELPDGTKSAGPITAVILDHRAMNLYYAKGYNPNDTAPPTCAAINAFVDDMAPPENLKTKKADACDGCPFNEWGSSPVGKGKACKNKRRIALIAPDADEHDKPMTIEVSPTGIKFYDALISRLTSEGKVPFEVITEISIDPDEDYPTLKFDVVDENPNIEFAASKLEAAAAILDESPIPVEDEAAA